MESKNHPTKMASQKDSNEIGYHMENHTTTSIQHVIKVGRVKLTERKETTKVTDSNQVNLGKTVIKHICTIEEPIERVQEDANPCPMLCCQKERSSQNLESVSEASEHLEPVGYATQSITIYQRIILDDNGKEVEGERTVDTDLDDREVLEFLEKWSKLWRPKVSNDHVRNLIDSSRVDGDEEQDDESLFSNEDFCQYSICDDHPGVETDEGTSESVRAGANDVMVTQVNGFMQSTQLFAQVGKTSRWFLTWITSHDGKRGTVNVNGRSVGVVLNDKGRVLVQRRNGRKSCKFNNEELQHFQLKEGANRATIRFTDYPSLQIHYVIWLMRQDEKIFVTDIDGTITKSNMSGFLFPKLGIDHHHPGVVKFLRGISDNGYRIIYLTARPLDLDEGTRDYLKSLEEDGVRLPDGPLFSSPVSFLDMVTSSRGHDVYKRLTLKTIVNLFDAPNDVIIGAIGNSDTDRMAYESTGVDKNRIFMVDKKSSIENVGSKIRTTYDDLLSRLDAIFPKHNQSRTS